MLFEIWIEGHHTTGMEEPVHAKLIGYHAGDDFLDACRKASKGTFFTGYGEFKEDNGVCSVWGCKLFNNKADAQKSFG